MRNHINRVKIRVEPDNFFEGSKESKEFNEIIESIRKEGQSYTKEIKSTQAEDWKVLANQTVGYEKF